MEYRIVMPILGFASVQKMRLEALEGPFFRLEGVEENAPTFTLIRPEALRDDYAFDLPDAAVARLGLKDPKDALVLNLMILADPIENSHINFVAPLVFNQADGTMAQVVLDGTKYPNFGVAEPLADYLSTKEMA